MMTMKKRMTEKEPDARSDYADIIDLPRHQSSAHPHMSLYNRAAQFSSYKALSGYEDMVAEEARQTESMMTPEGHELDILNQKLALIADVIRDGCMPKLSVTYFVPDEKKPGGSYVTAEARIRRVDTAFGKIELDSGNKKISGKKIEMDKIISIHGDLVDYLDDVMD